MSSEEIDVRKETVEAEKRIRPCIRETPLQHSEWLSRLGGCEVFLKLENLQLTGSFKLRGAASKLLALEERERKQGVVTASTGNHAGAVGYLLGKFGWPGTIFVPEDAAPAKVDPLRRLRVELRVYGRDSVETERCARKAAQDSGRVYVSPYNDPQVIGGQGTVGLELERQIERIDAALVPVGGGGLIAGIAGCLKAADPGVEMVGCQPRNSAVMYESILAGSIVERESLPTLSDGTAGGIEEGAITFPICRDRVDRFELVDEEEIRRAIRLVLQNEHLLIEGAAALPVAAFLKTAGRFAARRVVLVLSGAKIGIEALREVLA